MHFETKMQRVSCNDLKVVSIKGESSMLYANYIGISHIVATHFFFIPTKQRRPFNIATNFGCMAPLSRRFIGISSNPHNCSFYIHNFVISFVLML